MASLRATLARLRRWCKRAMISGPNRDRWQRPESVIAALMLRPGQRVADIGAGGGYFSLRLARAVGPTGTVYAIDTDPDMLESVRQAAAEAGLENVRPIRATPGGTALPEPVDLAFVCDAFHHLPEQRSFFEQFAPNVAPQGRIAIVESRPTGLMTRIFGHVTAPEVVRETMAAAGYRIVESPDLLERQSFQVFAR